MYHRPVLLAEVLKVLGLDYLSSGWFVDATLGDGGYSLEILKNGGKVIGLDVDPEALNRARDRLNSQGFEEGRDYRLVRGNFRDLKNLTSQTDTNHQKYQAVIFDLGVSSLQMDTPDRGFSFSKEAKLDMRMNPDLQVSASDLINGLTKGELDELIFKLGEEKLARRFAEAVVRARQVKRIETTSELANIIEQAIGRKRGKIHPATRVFQAIRIAVNDELHALKEALPQALDVLNGGGKLVVVSFHSLEDRIVKNQFKSWQDNGLGKILTKKPLAPSVEEIRENPRSRSGKLRAFQKYDDT